MKAAMGDWSVLSQLMDKVQSHSTVAGKVWLAVLFLFRIFILAVGVENIWGDEQENLQCNTLSPGCRNRCYDTSFPVSHPRFWVLQILSVSTPSLLHLGHILLVLRREKKRRRRRGGGGGGSVLRSSEGAGGPARLRGALLLSYVMQLVLKVVLEACFLAGQYFLYGSFLLRQQLSCSAPPCRAQVHCFVSRCTEKNLFIVFMLAVAVLSMLLNLLELLHLALCTRGCCSGTPGPPGPRSHSLGPPPSTPPEGHRQGPLRP